MIHLKTMSRKEDTPKILGSPLPHKILAALIN